MSINHHHNVERLFHSRSTFSLFSYFFFVLLTTIPSHAFSQFDYDHAYSQIDYDWGLIQNQQPSTENGWRKPSLYSYGQSQKSRDWRGLRKDTRYFLINQLLALAVIYEMPKEISGWTEEQKRNLGGNKYWDNVNSLTVDNDVWYINYLLHPYWGAAYYVRARHRGFGHQTGFWYSALLSALFEYGAEALFEAPSAQDLVVTPVAGAWLGQHFWNWRQRVISQSSDPIKLSGATKLAMVLTDPLASLNYQLDKMIFNRRELQFQMRLLAFSNNQSATGWGIRMQWYF